MYKVLFLIFFTNLLFAVDSFPVLKSTSLFPGHTVIAWFNENNNTYGAHQRNTRTGAIIALGAIRSKCFYEIILSNKQEQNNKNI